MIKKYKLLVFRPFVGISNPSLQIVLPQLLWESFDGIAQSSSWKGTVVLF